MQWGLGLILGQGIRSHMSQIRHSAAKLKKKKELPYDLAISLLGIQPKQTKTLIGKDMCTSMFVAALFTIDKIWKQPKCLPMDKGLEKM